MPAPRPSAPLQAFLSRRIVTPQSIVSGAVLVQDGRIRGIVAGNEIPPDADRTDFGNDALLPGLVDSHVHINEPGRSEWEGFYTATRAAAAGGYTMIVDMPLNSIPATTTVAALAAKRQAAEGKCRVDWAVWGGVVPNNQEEIEPLASTGVRGFKCFLAQSGVDEFRMVSESDLRTALPHVARTRLPLLVHAELQGPIDSCSEQLRNEDWRRYRVYWSSRPVQAETEAIAMMLSLCREFQFRLHIVHLSTADALGMLRAAKSEDLPVTIETCPHYLHFEGETIQDGATLTKCAPPIRSAENRERLWQGLNDGVIDFIVTDHSPCPPAMKRMEDGNFRDAWGGIASLSLALPVVWTESQRRGHSLSDIVRWMAERPAKLAGCAHHKGSIASGYDADFVVFDPDEDFKVTADRLHHRHAFSAYLGETLRGRVKKTYLRGTAVYDNETFPDKLAGREFRDALHN